MAKGLGASLWAWLNKPGAVAYLERTLEDERGKRKQAEAREKELRRRESGSANDLAVERLSHRDTRAKLDDASRALAAANEDRADLCKRLTSMVQSQAAMTARLVRAASSADDFLDLAESYAAENDELRRSIGDARNRLDRAG